MTASLVSSKFTLLQNNLNVGTHLHRPAMLHQSQPVDVQGSYYSKHHILGKTQQLPILVAINILYQLSEILYPHVNE